jgi:hypothetical protein
LTTAVLGYFIFSIFRPYFFGESDWYFIKSIFLDFFFLSSSRGIFLLFFFLSFGPHFGYRSIERLDRFCRQRSAHPGNEPMLTPPKCLAIIRLPHIRQLGKGEKPSISPSIHPSVRQ